MRQRFQLTRCTKCGDVIRSALCEDCESEETKLDRLAAMAEDRYIDRLLQQEEEDPQ